MKWMVIITAMATLVHLSVPFAFSFDKKEIISRRTEYAKFFDIGNGEILVEIYPRQVHVLTRDGAWVDICGNNSTTAQRDMGIMIPGENCYCCFNDECRTFFGYANVGRIGGLADPEFRTAYRWSTGGIDIPEIKSAFFEIFPSATYDTLFVSYLSCDPKHASGYALWKNCGSNIRMSLNDVLCNHIAHISFTRALIHDLERELHTVSGSFSIGFSTDRVMGPFAAINSNGILSLITFSPDSDSQSVLKHVSVSPNPFNRLTHLCFSLTQPSPVSLQVYSSTGQRVKAIEYREMSPGDHTLLFLANDLASGIYLYLLSTPSEVYRGKLLLLK